jgi:hypothetical protein
LPGWPNTSFPRSFNAIKISSPFDVKPKDPLIPYFRLNAFSGHASLSFGILKRPIQRSLTSGLALSVTGSGMTIMPPISSSRKFAFCGIRPLAVWISGTSLTFCPFGHVTVHEISHPIHASWMVSGWNNSSGPDPIFCRTKPIFIGSPAWYSCCAG